MKQEQEHFKNIPGWGIDADADNEPTYPMKNYTGDDHQRSNWDRPALQKPSVEVLHSNERPTYSAVIGETVPPTRLSGMVRRYAFQFSESSYGHWLPLLLADRINVVEGIADDLAKGKIPNIFVERGWNAEWKYNRPVLIQKMVMAAATLGAVVALYQLKKRIKTK
ncbi:hypothetical protein MUB18_14580 [Sphingobacterium sp. PCS056]|uniref:hypothetical protein n=1 Tax=Sphingobacterium sp. PCS056 TaxID=2931400 RepID=UPI00200F5E3E|nr:hypothetical protein [Sphingobacterium sp. PCS056]UPZ35333.1 hypothetical protein MUB18_14580 [Sphingobacterium sp. PCS056]